MRGGPPSTRPRTQLGAPIHQAFRRLVIGGPIALLVLCMLLPVGARAAQTGVVPDLTWGVSRSVQDRTAADLAEVGSQWVRLNISWSDWVSDSPGSYNNTALNHFDRGIELAGGAGSRVIVMVEESPSWARDSDNKNSPPRDNADLAEFMRFLADRYRGKVEAYQVWNEPNLWWAWPSGPNPAAYARMLKAVSPSIKAADPNAKVLFAGLSRNDYGFLDKAYAAIPDLGRYFDVMASHPYTAGGAPPERVWRDPNGRINKGAFAGYRELRRSMEAHGGAKPIWFTEFGWSTSTTSGEGVSPQTQADYLTRAYRCLEQDPYVEVATWYNFRNEWWAGDADTWHSQLGLMYTDFTRKPAYYALKSYVPGAGACTYSEAPAAAASPPTDSAAADSASEDSPTRTRPLRPATQRENVMLTVRRALLRRGRLAIAARVAWKATGKLNVLARYAGRRHRFAARIRQGKVRIEKRLPGGRRANAARVTLTYDGSPRFGPARTTLLAARHSARLRVRRALRDATGSARVVKVAGNLNRRARGSVRIRLMYRTAAGKERISRARARIRRGRFSRSMQLPSGARDAVMGIAFAGDRQRGISGETAARELTLRR